LCVHAVRLLLAELFENLNRKKLEIYGYDFTQDDGSAHRKRLIKAFDHHRPVHSISDRQVAEQVLADEIDVLIDLHGLSSGARPGIFALHPAPKQGTYLGFIGTTAMPWFDFVIADKCALPEALTPYFTEKPLYLNGSFIPSAISEITTQKVSRQQYGLPEEAFVMASFGNVYKITPEMFAIWMEILKKTTNSILWLIDDNPTTTNNLRLEVRKYDVDLSRVVFSPRTSPSEYRAKIGLADIFLDTFPYNCGSTSNDVLNAGVPLITLSGKTLVSRMGKYMLNSLGRKDFISESK